MVQAIQAKDIAKGRGHRAEGRREKIEGLRFQYFALS